jgi:hypothetical protein
MIFPITDLLDDGESSRWIARYFHPQGLRCPQCKSGVEQARLFRRSKRGLADYRCKYCDRVYNLYSGTVFAGCGLSARQAVLLVRGVCKGERSAPLAEELYGGHTKIWGKARCITQAEKSAQGGVSAQRRRLRRSVSSV